MTLGDEERKSLLQWVNSFTELLDDDVLELAALADGVVLSKIMHQIGPNYLDLEQIEKADADNWVMKSSNLRVLVRSIESFYHAELNQNPSEDVIFHRSEDFIATILNRQPATALDGDPTMEDSLALLVELILGCAIQCEAKSTYIHPILEMDSDSQMNLMHIIENLMHRFPILSPISSPRNSQSATLNSPSSSGLLNETKPGDELDSNIENKLDVGRSSSMDVEELMSVNYANELKVKQLTNEKMELLEKVEVLTEDCKKLNLKLAEKSSQDSLYQEHRQETLTKDKEKLQEIVEEEIASLTLQLEEKQNELAHATQSKEQKIEFLEHEIRRQADELDISRSKIVQLGKFETQIVKYKKKMEEMSMLRNQMRDLEEHNSQYLDKILDLESSVKVIPSLKEKIERYKNQVVDLETQQVEQQANASVAQKKIATLHEEYETAVAGKEFVEQQLAEMRQEMEMYHEQQNSSTLSNENFNSITSDSIASLREKVARLTRENKELLSSSLSPASDVNLSSDAGNNGNGDAVGSVNKQADSILQSQLDDALRVKSILQQKTAELKEQNDELASALKDAQSKSASLLNATNNSIQNSEIEINDLLKLEQNKTMDLKEQVNKMQQKIEDLTSSQESGDILRVTVDELTNRLKSKESIINTLTSDKEKLENYTKKTLHAVQTKYMVAMGSHKNQLSEKNDKLDLLETKLRQVQQAHTREQALLMSAFYEVGGEIQRRSLMPNANNAVSTSWLPAQRNEERAKRRV